VLSLIVFGGEKDDLKSQRGGIMLARFIYLKEDSKFFIVASVVCALILLAVIASTLGVSSHDLKYNDWTQVILSMQ
jgi:hypothetical protein